MLPQGCNPRCTACPHRELSSRESEAQKHRWLSEKLGELNAPGGVEPVRALGADQRWGYRNKITLRAELHEGRWRFGLHKKIPGTWEYELIEIPECPVHSVSIQKILKMLPELLPQDGSLPLAFVMITGSILSLVIKAHAVKDLGAFGSYDFAQLGLTGVYLHFNPSTGDRVTLARGWKLIWGDPDAQLELNQISFSYGPSSFQQLIPSLYLDALAEAETFLRISKQDAVLDLCSGVGVSVERWRRSSSRVLGVELGGESVRCARKNLGEHSGEEWILQGRCSERIPQMVEFLKQGAGCGEVLVFANPPRLGLEFEVVQWLAETARPQRIAYLSCSAGTLLRDVSFLKKAGYGVTRIIPYDFFPQTQHVETLVLLEHSSAGLSGSADSRSAARTHG